MLAEAHVALDFQRYLLAKRTVDDRAMNGRVWEAFTTWLGARPGQGRAELLEIGAGVGTMLERLVARGVLARGAYTAVDADPGNTLRARERLGLWAGARGAIVREEGPRQQRIIGEHMDVQASFVTGEALHFARLHAGRQAWDALLAHAFLDLVNLSRALAALKPLIRPAGVMYATLNFDGDTIFQPDVDAALEQPILAAYHRTMDERRVDGQPSGEARTGRHLFGELATAGYELMEAGASDWVVVPRHGAYPADEAYFLRFIVSTVVQAVSGQVDVPQESLEQWANVRMQQIERCELIYIAHQLDVLARAP